MVEFGGERSMMARQTIFGLLGDIEKVIYDPRQVFLPELIRLLKCNLEHDSSTMTVAGFSNQS